MKTEGNTWKSRFLLSTQTWPPAYQASVLHYHSPSKVFLKRTLKTVTLTCHIQYWKTGNVEMAISHQPNALHKQYRYYCWVHLPAGICPPQTEYVTVSLYLPSTKHSWVVLMGTAKGPSWSAFPRHFPLHTLFHYICRSHSYQNKCWKGSHS